MYTACIPRTQFPYNGRYMPEMKILTARIPADLYDKIAQLGGARGVSTVARQVLEKGLAAEAPTSADERTAWALRFVAWAARAIEINYGKPWHQSPFLTRVYTLATAIYLSGGQSNVEVDGEVADREPPKPGSSLAFVLTPPFVQGDPLDPQVAARALNLMWVIRQDPDVQATYGVPVLPPEPKG